MGGLISVFFFVKLVVLEVFILFVFNLLLVYRNYRCLMIKFVDLLRVQNMLVEKMILLIVEKLIEFGVYNVFLYGRSGLDYDIVEIKIFLLENKSNF